MPTVLQLVHLHGGAREPKAYRDLPDVIVIRGAPGSGKSTAGKCLAARLGRGSRVEVDTLRSMIIPVDWKDQAEHVGVLSVATRVVEGFLGLGHGPVIVIDTFSGNKLTRFIAELRALREGLDLRLFALVPTLPVLRTRVEGRPGDQFKDLSVCEKLNADALKFLQPGERVIDNSALSPEETADALLLACASAERSGRR